jgi:hypothetical protein
MDKIAMGALNSNAIATYDPCKISFIYKLYSKCVGSMVEKCP